MTSAPEDLATSEVEDVDSAPEDVTRYQAEERRLVALLARIAKQQGISVRKMEARAGVGASVFAKVIIGKVSPTMRHLLRMCDALDLTWDEFYTLALHDDGRQVDDFETKVLAVLARAGVLPPTRPPSSGAPDATKPSAEEE